MKLAYIPPGKFTMGSPENEGGRNGVEGDETEHEVEITRGFYIGVYEVTQAEYEKVMGTNPSRFSAAGDYKAQVARLNTARFPVDSVDHGDAVDFCNSTVTDSQGPPSWAAPCRGGGKPPVLACQW
jgi:formylglycine-generating enzyme required for sulfatase activity